MSQVYSTEDLIGCSSLIDVYDFKLEEKPHFLKEQILFVKHAQKKVLAITIIAFLVGNIK